MCGICGIVFFNGERVSELDIKKMNDLLYHRGPDSQGYFIKDNIAIAMRRLSIIDLKTGDQPISNEDQKIQVILNGEIYNFLKLKEDLIKKGHRFKSKTDTEVIAHLYEEYGIDFVRHLRGMFAFCLVDLKNSKIFLCRDRMGKKPLMYYIDSNFIAFSSELRSLVSFSRIKKTVNLKAIDIYLVLQYIPSPLTIYNEINQLDPASLMEVDIKTRAIKKYKYWDLPLPADNNMNFADIKTMLKNIVFESTKLRMISDVEIGAFLSGGIDSSIVVATMASLSDKKIKTFSIGFKEKRFNELDYAREVAKMYGTEHYELVVDESMLDVVEKLPLLYGQPYADQSAIPTYYISKLTSKYVKVALNGDGGDENFAGYSRYVAIKLADILKVIPANAYKLFYYLVDRLKDDTAPYGYLWRFKKFLKILKEKTIEDSYLNTVSFFSISEKNNILSYNFITQIKEKDIAKKYIGKYFSSVDGDIIKRVCYVDLNTYLPQCLMTKMDIASMANSLETRSPLLDHKLIEFASTIDSSYKLRGFSRTKYILKETFKDMLPPKILKRSKMGFSVPLGIWFCGELKKKFEDVVLSKKSLSRGYFKVEEIKRLWDEHQSRKKDHGYKLWALLNLELWHNHFMDDFKL